LNLFFQNTEFNTFCNHVLYKHVYKEGMDIFEAALTGDLGRIRELLDEGVDPNSESTWYEPPLHIAAACGHVECVTELLDRGATIDLENDYDETPLNMAVINNQKEVVRLLLERDRHKSSYITHSDGIGRNVLHIAASAGYSDILSIFLEIVSADDLKLVDSMGKTPFDLAKDDTIRGMLEEIPITKSPQCN